MFLFIQFRSRRDYNQHIEAHKEELIKKVKQMMRSVLILQKHGILIEEVRLTFNCFYNVCIGLVSAGVQQSGWEATALQAAGFPGRSGPGTQHA